MATFSLEFGMRTVGFADACALRIRVNMSAMGSVMLIIQFLYSASISQLRKKWITSSLYADRARRPAWLLREVCDGPARTCGTHRANGRSARSDYADGWGSHRAAVSAASSARPSCLRRK